MSEPQEPVQHYVLNAETGFLEVKLTQPAQLQPEPKLEESDDGNVQ